MFSADGPAIIHLYIIGPQHNDWETITVHFTWDLFRVLNIKGVEDVDSWDELVDVLVKTGSAWIYEDPYTEEIHSKTLYCWATSREKAESDYENSYWDI